MSRIKRRIRISIADKIVFFLLCAGSVVTLVWNVFKDFIPNEYQDVKLLIMILGALSGFFAFLSFYWDRKFSSVEKGVTSKQEELTKTLDNKIQVFLNEDFRSAQTFNEAITSIIKSKPNGFDNVKIFAYSAKNYIEFFQRSSVKIKHLQLCLRRASDYSAWFMRSSNHIDKYYHELNLALDNLENLKDSGQIEDYEIRFYDFEAYSHFGIFDQQIMFGDLLPMFSEKKTVKIGSIQSLSNIGRNQEFFKNKNLFWDYLFDGSVSDSGLKRRIGGCHYCDTSAMILDPHHLKSSAVKNNKCDIPLMDCNFITDFILEPDFYPVSELHMLLVCKFHILSFYDYLCHKGALQEMNSLAYIIRNTIFKETGKDIVFFEHGSANQGSELSASSIEHLHLHIIYKPANIDIVSKIESEQICDENYCMHYKSLSDFASEPLLRNKDYFLLWEPGESEASSKFYVWMPKRKESQFLRKIFFQCLTDEEKLSLYGKGDGFFDDEYNWKMHKFNYSEERLQFHVRIGSLIQKEIEKWKKSNN